MAVNLANYSYLHAAGDGGPRRGTQVICIHATDNTASAEAEANYATHRPDQTSAHFYVDGTTAYRGLPLDNIAYGCLWHGNQISVQLELCGRSNQLSDATLRQAAPIVAALCAKYGIPVRKISPAQVANGTKGIVGHADITAAFPQDGGDHTDPGASFPWATFINYVNGGTDMAFSAQQEQDLAVMAGHFNHEMWLDGEKMSAHILFDNLYKKLKADVAAAPTAGAVDPLALATALAGNEPFIRNLAAAMATAMAVEAGRRLVNG